MIACHKHKFIFIKGLKVASTSVEMALSALCDDNDIITPISPVDEYARLKLGAAPRNYSGDLEREGRYIKLIGQKRFNDAHAWRVHSTTGTAFYNHMPIALVEERLKFPAAQYDLVYVIRSPYEKIISYANMMLSFARYSGAAMVNSIADIRGGISEIMQSGDFLKVNNAALYQSETAYKSRIEIRHETLHRDYENFLTHLNLSGQNQDLPHAKKGVLDQNLDPVSLFTRAQLNEINRLFANEFDQYGYQKL